jgi:putative transposase
VDDVVKTMGIEGMSKSQVSVLAKELGDVIERFRNRPLDQEPYGYGWGNALVHRCLQGGRIVNVATVVATGVNSDGRHDLLGMDVFTTEDGAPWLAFLRCLVARGLPGVKLVISIRIGGCERPSATRRDEALHDEPVLHTSSVWTRPAAFLNLGGRILRR